MLLFDQQEYSEIIKKITPFTLVHNADSARNILSTLITGTISLTVFSFSMVMIVISQAASNFSPRVIPGLLSKKSHQLVLGFYIGTIVYTTVLLGSLGSRSDNSTILGIGIIFSIFFTITCLILFIYFIHSISKSIQVDSIIKGIFTITLQQLKKNNNANNDADHLIPNTSEWHIITSSFEGYLKIINYPSLTRLAQDNNIIIDILVPKGEFLVKHYPLFKTNKNINDNTALRTALLNCFITYADEYIEENYFYGFKQISEIAVKALSPGINDPGTAIHAIDLLTILYLAQMEMHEVSGLSDDDGQLRVIDKSVSFNELLYRYMSPIRGYGKADIIIIIKLLDCLSHLLYADIHGEHTASLIRHTKIIIDDADKAITNPFDREKINEIVGGIASLNSTNLFLPYLTEK